MSDTRTYQIGDRACAVSYGSIAQALAPPAGRRPLYITDEHIAPSVRAALQGSQPDFDPRCLLVLPAGEETKAWAQVEAAILRGFELGLARDDWIIGVGGGVICDMAAFAASVYMRGCQLVLVPTTLLCMVDAALGGKTGINFGGHKNMVGTFYPAQELRVAADFLRTLPAAEYLDGLAEVIKHAMLDSPELWRMLHDQQKAILAREPALLRRLVELSLDVKGRVVEADPKENGPRAHLNLGHTFAHALEAVAGFGEWSHGAAVAWGLVQASRLSAQLGHCSPSYADEVRGLIASYGYKLEPRADPAAILAAMKLDKKKKGGVVRFVLQRGLGQTFTDPVDDAVVVGVLATVHTASAART